MGRPSRIVAANIKNTVLIEERRERIVQAGIEVFLAKGFHGASTRDVCLRAGMTPGTLYNYVRTKEDILFLICDRAVARYREAIATAIEGVPDPRQRLVRAVRAMVEAQAQHRKSILLVLREAHALDPPARLAVQKRVDGFVDSIRDLIAGALPDASAHKVSVALLAEAATYLPTMLAMRQWRIRRELASDDVVASLVAMILQMLGAEPDGNA